LNRNFDKYKIVKYSPELRDQIIELQKFLWSRNLSRNAAYLEWKYDHNPYLDTTLIYTILSAGQLVGMVGVYGAKWQIGDPRQTWLWPCIGDLVIHPDHRNQGLYPELMAFVLDDLSDTGYAYVFDFGLGWVALPMLMRGWRSIYLQTAHWHTKTERNSGRRGKFEYRQALPTLIYRRLQEYAGGWPRLLSAYRLLRNWKRLLFSKLSSELDRSFKYLDRPENQQHRQKNCRISVRQTPRPDAMAELVERVGSDGRLQQVRDKQFFAWRFKNPLSQFRFLFLEDAGLEGYIVLQAPVYAYDGKARVNIVDWEVSNVQVWAGLLQAAIGWGNFDKLTIWSATLSDETNAILQEMDFKFVNKTGRITQDIDLTSIMTRPVRQDMLQTDWVVADRRLLDSANWDLRMIFSDDF
jgi:GNAT superfamily N-acetyltransferase